MQTHSDNKQIRVYQGLEEAEWGFIVYWYRIRVWGDEHFWKLIAVMVARHCECNYAAELYICKWLRQHILCCICFTIIKKNSKKRERKPLKTYALTAISLCQFDSGPATPASINPRSPASVCLHFFKASVQFSLHSTERRKGGLESQSQSDFWNSFSEPPLPRL